MHIAKIIQCCFIIDSECNTISQNKTVDIIKIFQPELDLQHFQQGARQKQVTEKNHFEGLGAC